MRMSDSVSPQMVSNQLLEKSEISPLVNVGRFIDEAFKIDRRLRTVGILDDNRNILALRTRSGYDPLIPVENAKDYFSVLPRIVMDEIDKLRRYLGNMSMLFVKFDETVLVYYRFHNTIIMFSFDPKTPTSFLDKIPESFRQIANDYL